MPDHNPSTADTVKLPPPVQPYVKLPPQLQPGAGGEPVDAGLRFQAGETITQPSHMGTKYRNLVIGARAPMARSSVGGEPVDADGDGAQDRVGVDDTGPAGKPDGLVDRQVPVEVMRAPGGRRVRVAVLGFADPEPALPRLPDVIRSNSEYDVSAVTRPLNDAIARVTGNWKRWKNLCVYVTPILCVACIAFGWWWRGAVFAAPLPAGTTRSARVLDALYRRGHVPPEAEGAARKALIEDGAGDPEGELPR